MPIYVIDSFRGGISDYSNKGIPGSYKFGYGLDIRKNDDTLSCQQALVEEDNITFSGLIRFIVDATDGNVYGFDNVGKIYKRDSSNDWSVVYTDPDGEIKGAAEFPSTDGVSYLVWATDTKLKCKELPGATDWSDANARANFPRTDLTSADWHTMTQAGGDLVFVNKNTLGALGYDNSYSPNVCDLVPGNVGKSIIERHGRSIVGTHHPGDSTGGVNAMVEAEVPLMQVGNEGGIYFNDMNSSLPDKVFPGGGRVNPGAVTIDAQQVALFEWVQANSSDPDINSWIDKKQLGGVSLWGVFNADSGMNGVYAYGRKRRNHPFVLTLEYYLDVDEIGAVAKCGSDIVISYRSGSDFGVKRVDTTTKATGVYEGLEKYLPPTPAGKSATLKYAEVFMKPLPSGCSIEFYYKVDKASSWTQAKTQGGDTSFSEEGGEEVLFMLGENAQIYEPKIVLNPSGNSTPEVYKIETHLDL